MAGSILETFYILFESDSKEVKQGAEEATRATDKLQDKLNATNRVTDKVGQSFLRAAAGAAAVIGSLVSVGVLLSGFRQSINMADQLGDASESLGIAVEDLSAWGNATKIAGGSTQGFISSIDSLSKSMATMDAVGKSRVAPFFKQLGISMLDAKGKIRPVLDMLPELADSFQKISKQESRAIGQKLGLDEGTIMLLQRGREKVEAMLQKQRELGVTTKEEADLASDFNDELDYAGMAFQSIYRSVGLAVLPALTKLLTSFTGISAWVRKNSNLIEGFFIAMGAVLVVYTQRMVASAIATGFLGKALNFLAANKMVLIILALAAAFAVLYDDIQNFRAGNNSVIGDLIAGWSKFWDNFNRGLDRIGGYFDKKMEDFRRGWQFLADIIHSIWQGVEDGILAAISAIVDAINWARRQVGLTEIEVKRTYSDDERQQTLNYLDSLGLGQNMLASANSTPINSMSSNSIINSGKRDVTKNNNVSIGEINIQTQATDAQGISYAIGQGLDSVTRQTMSNYDDGWAY